MPLYEVGKLKCKLPYIFSKSLKCDNKTYLADCSMLNTLGEFHPPSKNKNLDFCIYMTKPVWSHVLTLSAWTHIVSCQKA